MSHIRRKYTAGLVLVAMFTLVAGLCYGTVSQAAVQRVIVTAPDLHCGTTEQNGQTKTIISERGYPIGSSVMPCCVDRHDNIPTTVPASSKDRVNSAAIVTELGGADAASYVGQKTYLSSFSPPPRPDKLYSLLKKE